MRARVLVPFFLVAACAADEGAEDPREPLTVQILEEPLSFGESPRALAGVNVALDPADGAGPRETQRSGPDGRVTFGVDPRKAWSVTVLSDDHVYVTMLEAAPGPAPLVLTTPPLERVVRERTVGLRGTIAGKRDKLDVVSVATSSVAWLGATRALQESFDLRVPRERPFFLIGHETQTLLDRDGFLVSDAHVKSFRLDLPARGDDQLLDLDLAALPSLPVRNIVVKATIPPSFGEGTRAYAAVNSADSGLEVGLYAAARTGGGEASIDLAMVDTGVGSERLVSRVELLRADGARALRTELGTMTDGMRWSELPDPPPAPAGATVVTDPLGLDGFPAGAELRASLFAGGKLVWILRGPPGGPRAPSFRIPYRGEIASVDVQLFALTVTALRDPIDGSGGLYRRASTSRDITLRKK